MAITTYNHYLFIVICLVLCRSTLQQIRFIDTDSVTDQPLESVPYLKNSASDQRIDTVPYFNNSSTEQQLESVPYFNNFNNPNNFNELPVNITIPGPDSEQVVSELNEPDRNRTGILQWILGLAGLNKPTTQAPEVLTPPADCPACVCGMTNKHKRIVGGQETQVNEYPWMTLLKYGPKFYCAASLISDKYLLTASHCVNGFDQNRITALFLEHDRKNSSETRTFYRKITKVIKHPNYNTRNYDNDIAILRLNQTVSFENSLRPVCLPPGGDSFAGQEGVVTGWGAVAEGGALANTLQEVAVPIMSNKDCRKTNYGSSRITDNMLCAGITEGGKDSCQGDSGGPLHVVIDTKYHEVGVVSWGQGCAEPNYPGVYSRVGNYISWIKSSTIDSCYC